MRYIQWFINAPLLLLSVFLGVGFPLGATFSTLFLADAAVVSGLVGALVHSTYKWGYYVFAVFSLFYVLSVDLHFAVRVSQLKLTRPRIL